MLSRNTLLLVVGLECLAATIGCRRGVLLVGPPVAANGVRIELVSARAKGEEVDISLMAFNDLDQPVVINRNQIAIVGKDGNSYYRAGGRDIHTVKPRGRHAVNLDAHGAGLAGAPGYYLRFDGVYANSMRIEVPPMAVGQPTAGPGQANANFAPPPPPKSLKDKVADKFGSQATPTGGMEQYGGPRRQIKSPGAKCAAIPMKAVEVPEQLAFIMDEVLLTELHQVGFEAIGPDDINAMIGFEKVKDAVGCDDASCIAELGNALGVEYLVAGNVAKLEGSMVLTLKLIDVRQTKVLARASRMADGGQTTVPRLIGEAVQELVQRSSL